MTASLLVATYGVVFLHLTGLVLLTRHKEPVHYFFSAFLFDFALMSLVGGSGAVQDHPAPAYYIGTFAFILLLAPLGASYINAFLGTLRKNKTILAILATVGIMFALGVFLGYAGLSWKRVLGIGYSYLLIALFSVSLDIYAKIGPYRELTTNLKLFFLCLWGASLQLLALSLFQLLEFRPGMHVLWILITVTVVVHFALVVRNPEMYREYKDQTTTIRERKTRLEGIDVPMSLDLLRESMERDKIYRNPNLQLEGAADRVNLTPPQLSELINRHTGKNFTTYVNEYRVAEAKEQLTERPDKSVLNIAFDCGFASKSSFNSVFRAMTGSSPREYRTARKASPAHG